MLTLHMKQDPNALELARHAIARGESFAVIMEGFTARMVKKMRPLFAYLSGIEKRKLGKLEWLMYVIYALFIGDFGVIHRYAMKAGMIASWEEKNHSVAVSFRFAQK